MDQATAHDHGGSAVKFYTYSHGRAHIATTPTVLGELDWTILVHREQDAHEYIRAGWPEDRVVPTHTEPGPYAPLDHRAYAYRNLMEPREWAVFLDDDIKEVREYIGGDRKLPRTLTPNEINEKAEEARRLAETRNFNCFFSAHRQGLQRWLFVGATKPSWLGWRKVDKPFPLDLRIRHEEQLYLAEHLLRDGGIVMDSWLDVRNSRFDKDGLGTYEKRYESRVRDAKFLYRQYPGLFKLIYSSQATDRSRFPEPSDLQLRIWTEKGIRKWRRELAR